jgi:xanthine dehydrogenase/oxidase
MQAKRRDDDIAIVTSCFALRVTADGDISHARLSYGGMAAWTISTPKTEAFLIGKRNFLIRFIFKLTHYRSSGKPFSYPTLEEALTVLGAEIDLPFDVPGGMPSFRKTLALSFLFKFWNAVSIELNIPLDADVTVTASPEDITGTIHRQASSGHRDNSVSFLCLWRGFVLKSVRPGSVRARSCWETGTAFVRS